ncbi:MAG: SDR family oxidoreductase [Candidatus Omnitrophica bacterium]|nr:SDR family oxidoreductase [Candidatus Omnitrophota bacterium]
MVSDSINLITGASGFIGLALCRKMLGDGMRVRGAVRKIEDASRLPQGVDIVQVEDVNESTDWQQALAGVDTVIHLAARVHIMNNSVVDPVEAFRKVNVLGTERLARMAAKAGVYRFIYLSSIGVNGEFTEKDPFTEECVPNPVGAYAVSKWEAEQSLQKVAENSGMKVVILRSPLVYGSDAPGNFGRLMHLIKARMPLPFGSIKNLRSFIYLGNLVDAITTCIAHPLAAGESFIVSDGQDVSTPDLIKMIACALNKKPVLFSLHPGILRALCKIAGKTEELEKLTGPLFVDSSKIRNLLGWKPPFTLEEGIKETIKHYKA